MALFLCFLSVCALFKTWTKSTETVYNTSLMYTKVTQSTARVHKSDTKYIKCDWQSIFNKLKHNPKFDLNFNNFGFDDKETISFINKKTKEHCYKSDSEYIWKFGNGNIAITTIFIIKSNNITLSDNITLSNNIFSDIRTFHFKLSNTLRYCEIHGYDFILQFKPIFKYNKLSFNNKYIKYMSSPTFQKPFLILKYLNNYSWILFLDYDTIIVHCNYSIEKVLIQYAAKINSNHTSLDKISIIFGSEARLTINAGIFLIKNNKFSHNILNKWIFITENAEKFKLLSIPNMNGDQDLFIAVLQNFNITKWINHKNSWKGIQEKKQSVALKYIDNPQFRLKYPIYDNQFAKYEVAIDESIINSKIYIFRKKPETRNGTFIIHYYAKGKYHAFKDWKYVIQHCKYLT